MSKIAAEDLVFLDEAGAHLGMTRTHARSPRGERALCKRSAAYKSNISMVGAITPLGMRELYPYDGSINGELFLSFLDRLLPKLGPHNVVVMDNLRVHHMHEVKQKFQQAGIRLLYLPPYSPERNPIEEAWSLIKRVFRAAEADTIAKFVDTLQSAAQSVTAIKATNFFRHAGYAL